MGYAIAEALAEQGADVDLISGPVNLNTKHPNIRVTPVESAGEMLDASLTHFPECDGAVMCAAVADFTPSYPADSKTKRGKENWNLELKPTEDIAARLGKLKNNKQILVGFALETQQERENALKKLQKKNLDFIVLNSLNDKGAGFQVDTNKISIFDKDNNHTDFELKSKKDVAVDIVDKIIAIQNTQAR